jgi:hypothetical protein
MAWELPWREEPTNWSGSCSTIVDAAGASVAGCCQDYCYIEDGPRATILEAVNGRAALLARVAALEAMLRELEWVGGEDGWPAWAFCPVCRVVGGPARADRRHLEGCRLAAALAG